MKGLDIGLILGPPPDKEESPLVELANSLVGKSKGQDLYDLICEIIEEKRAMAEADEADELEE